MPKYRYKIVRTVIPGEEDDWSGWTTNLAERLDKQGGRVVSVINYNRLVLYTIEIASNERKPKED